MRVQRLRSVIAAILVTAAVLAAGVLTTFVAGCSKDNPRIQAGFNSAASLPAALPWNPLQGRVITTWIDKRNRTTSTLYGNDVAVNHTRTSSGEPYPRGTIIALVTWNQQEDERWFGGNIPAALRSVELVTLEGAPNQSARYTYRDFQGSPLHQTTSETVAAPTPRAAYLLLQRPALMP